LQCNRRRSESSRVDGFVAGVIRDALGVGIDVNHQLVASDGLLLQQIQGDLVQQAAMLPQQLLGAFKSILQQLLDLVIGGRGIRDEGGPQSYARAPPA